MPQPHWHLEDGTPGCLATECTNKATWQWAREATPAETAAETNREGPYGPVHRNTEGPQRVAVYACDEHTPKRFNADEQPEHNLDKMAQVHEATCVLPDLDCNC